MFMDSRIRKNDNAGTEFKIHDVGARLDSGLHRNDRGCEDHYPEF